MPSRGEAAEPAVLHGKPLFSGSWHPWTTGPVGGGAVRPRVPRWQRTVLVQGGRPGAHALARRAARRAASPYMRYSRIQQLYVPGIDAARPELSTDVWVGGSCMHACPSFSRVKSAGKFRPTEIGRLHETNITPSSENPRSTGKIQEHGSDDKLIA